MNYLCNDKMLNVGNFHKGFHVPKEEIQIIVLSPAQLNYLIHNEKLSTRLSKELSIIKDVFVFGCTVALRFSDLMALLPLHLVKRENGHYLIMRSQKTGFESSLKLPQYAIDILTKYQGIQKNLLPVFGRSYFNVQLKKLVAYIDNGDEIIKYRMRRGKPVPIYKSVGSEVNFTQADHITSHTMRRTAITTMLRLGMAEQAVRKISGHTANSKEFYKYVAYSQNYLDSETDQVFEKLIKII